LLMPPAEKLTASAPLLGFCTQIAWRIGISRPKYSSDHGDRSCLNIGRGRCVHTLGRYGAGIFLSAKASQSRLLNQGWALISAAPVFPHPRRNTGLDVRRPWMRLRRGCWEEQGTGRRG
jgi:hypothetical protein